jgi:hypothetical protein
MFGVSTPKHQATGGVGGAVRLVVAGSHEQQCMVRSINPCRNQHQIAKINGRHNNMQCIGRSLEKRSHFVMTSAPYPSQVHWRLIDQFALHRARRHAKGTTGWHTCAAIVASKLHEAWLASQYVRLIGRGRDIPLGEQVRSDQERI